MEGKEREVIVISVRYVLHNITLSIFCLRGSWEFLGLLLLL